MNAILVGWGDLGSQKSKKITYNLIDQRIINSDYLVLIEVRPCKQQHLKMRIVSADECKNYYARGLVVEMCTVGDEMPCSGYNGSPLILKHGNMNFLVGICYSFAVL